MKIKFLIFGIYATCFSFGALAVVCDGPATMLINEFCVCVPGAVQIGVNECECKPGSVLNDAGDECVCVEGATLNDYGECECKKGFELNNNNECACPPASTLVGNKCDCVPGAQRNGNGVCECKPGSELNSNNQCVCKNNFNRPAGSDECVCEAGFYLHNDQYYWCGQCEIGTYKDTLGNSIGGCKKCPTHETTLGKGKTSVDDCFCDKGYYLREENGDRVCLACPAATYKDHVGDDTACEPCSSRPDSQGTPLATYSNEGASECSLCPKGSCCFDGLKYDCNIGTYSSNLGTFCATANPVASQPQCEDNGDSGSNNNGGGGGGGQCIPG